MIKQLLLAALFTVTALFTARAAPAQAEPCQISNSTIAALKSDFLAATHSPVGPGFFNPRQMWGAVVDRDGRLCELFKTGDAWPGSRAIAIAKASTANDFSNASNALSTANLYGLALPGGSLFGLNQSNAFNPLADDPRLHAEGFVPGGIITFGGGVALYESHGVIGGFGVSGDSACADHNVAYLTRRMAIANHVLSAPPNNDNISFLPYPAVINTTSHVICLPGDVVPPR